MMCAIGDSVSPVTQSQPAKRAARGLREGEISTAVKARRVYRLNLEGALKMPGSPLRQRLWGLGGEPGDFLGSVHASLFASLVLVS